MPAPVGQQQRRAAARWLLLSLRLRACLSHRRHHRGARSAISAAGGSRRRSGRAATWAAPTPGRDSTCTSPIGGRGARAFPLRLVADRVAGLVAAKDGMRECLPCQAAPARIRRVRSLCDHLGCRAASASSGRASSRGRSASAAFVRASVLEQGAPYHLLGGVPIAERTATAAGADHLVAVPEGKRRFVAQVDGQRNRSQEQMAKRVASAGHSGRSARIRRAQTMPSLNPVRTLILSARALRLISARQASMSSTSSNRWTTWPRARPPPGSPRSSGSSGRS